MKVKVGDEIYAHGSLYYACRANPYEETGESGQGIVTSDCWYKVLEINDDKGAFIEGPRESLWLSWYILNEKFERYFWTLEDMDERQKALAWLGSTEGIEASRTLALTIPMDKIVETYRSR